MNDVIKMKKMIVIMTVGWLLLTSMGATSTQVNKQSQQNNSFLDPPPEVEWDKTYLGPGMEYGYRVEQTSDGGYIATGRIETSLDNVDAWAVKTDAEGELEWSKTYGGSNEDQGYTIQQTDDGGYIVIGGTLSYGTENSAAWLVKLDSNGDEMWNKTYSDGIPNDTTDGCQTSDGGYIFTGSIETSSNNWDAWVVKTDAMGYVEWEIIYGDILKLEAGFSIQQTDDNGYIVAGDTATTTYQNALLIKINQQGNIIWDKIYGEQFFGAHFIIYSVDQTLDDGYILAGTKNSQSSPYLDNWLVKTDLNGNEEWSKTISSTQEEWEILYCVRQTDDGEYIMAELNVLGRNFKVIKAYENGNEKWSKTFEGTSRGLTYDVEITSDGGYIISGYQASNNGDLRLIKLKKEEQPPNTPPNSPDIDGPTSGKKGTEYNYTFVTADPEGQDVYYWIDWGDGTVEQNGWIGPYDSGEELNFSHSWNRRGSYQIKAKAKDTRDAVSDWGYLEVEMPYNNQGSQSSRASSSSQTQSQGSPSGTEGSSPTSR